VTSTKVYIEIVKQLREMITVDGLESGDKLPSERELTERLNVGRSSVREALRALELLGLIETRRGEGTFIRDFRGHQLVQLLSTFILQDERAKRDVFETKNLIEWDCLSLALKRASKEDIMELRQSVKTHGMDDDDFFCRIIELADNHLFLRMWLILKDYYYSLHAKDSGDNRDMLISILDSLLARDKGKLQAAYGELRNLSEF
jgi:GntR family transcriptional repressor for pyruvate dehydrogenase complex